MLSLAVVLPEPGSLHSAPDLLAVVRDLADVGVILLMFVAGLETDLAEMRRVGKVLLGRRRRRAADGGRDRHRGPFGLPLYWEGCSSASSDGDQRQHFRPDADGAWRAALARGRDHPGRAVIDDVMGIIVLSFVVVCQGSRQEALMSPPWRWSSSGWRRTSLRVAAGPPWPGAPLGEPPAGDPGHPAGAVVHCFMRGRPNTAAASPPFTGAYVAGRPGADAVQATDRRRVHPLTYSIFVPLFFIGIGLQANGRELGDSVAFGVAGDRGDCGHQPRGVRATVRLHDRRSRFALAPG